MNIGEDTETFEFEPVDVPGEEAPTENVPVVEPIVEPAVPESVPV